MKSISLSVPLLIVSMNVCVCAYPCAYASSRLITDFFTKSKNQTQQTIDVNDDDLLVEEATVPASKKFYEECLIQQKSTCSSDLCARMKNSFELNIKDTEKKIENIRQAIETCTSIISEKNNEIDELNTKLKAKRTANDNTPNNCCGSDSLIFSEFADKFTQNQIAGLRKIGKTKREDSTFVSLTVNSLYEGQLEMLQNRSVTGRSKAGKKEKMTPEKKEFLKIYSKND